jgi:outer membrane protein OmpA-like peptidoglycan-associated protein
VRIAALVGLWVFGLTATARAGDAISVELIPKAQKGQGQPELVVRAQEPLAGLVLDVRRNDGKNVKAKAGAQRPGDEHRFVLPLEVIGAATYKGQLTVHFKEVDPATMPLEFNVELLPPLQITVVAADLDLKAQRLAITANRPLARVQVSLLSDTGANLGGDERNLGEPDGNGKYAIEWQQEPGTILKIGVQGWDASGFFGGLDLFPWRVDIPHEEVNFRSGKFDVDPSETPKLEASFELVQGAVKKYGKLATIRLFVAGHTDTVGDAGSNRSLSDNRAKALGRWFKKRGLKIPVSYAGFGEDLLLVETPDETDEAKNRRAEYIVAVEGPTIKGKAVTWRALD